MNRLIHIATVSTLGTVSTIAIATALAVGPASPQTCEEMLAAFEEAGLPRSRT